MRKPSKQSNPRGTDADLNFPVIKAAMAPPSVRSIDEINSWIESDFPFLFDRASYEQRKRDLSVETRFSLNPERQRDTSKSLRKRYRSPAQKWEEAVKLRELAWNLKWASIKQSHPQWSDEQIKSAVREIFLNATT
jgi:hypothetical protein